MPDSYYLKPDSFMRSGGFIENNESAKNVNESALFKNESATKNVTFSGFMNNQRNMAYSFRNMADS